MKYTTTGTPVLVPEEVECELQQRVLYVPPWSYLRIYSWAEWRVRVNFRPTYSNAAGCEYITSLGAECKIEMAANFELTLLLSVRLGCWEVPVDRDVSETPRSSLRNYSGRKVDGRTSNRKPLECIKVWVSRDHSRAL